MNFRVPLVLLATVVMTGCASVSMESKDASSAAKRFGPPSEGNAQIYVFRSGSFGGALKKDIWINGECIGESAPNVFFVKEVKGDVEHKVSTESEFSPNDLVIKVKSGVNYFVRQFMKMGLLVGGAGVELVSEEDGKKEIAGLELAKSGNCSKK
ncbi:DUF2846 domain-containing protein [Rhodoferax sp. AJA081-3]|uniref:DUF2846 domain-containing protein n=1 Tax=Rhodoferax sp. AJA081-3 TaxID=2752316 RepID=UPI001FD754B8|nr:DUF2846 domain-containing protein [Rhodoferax sp. AJA081-3]